MAVTASLGVKRVEVPEAILSSLSLPGAAEWARLTEPAMVVMAVTLAVIASAEACSRPPPSTGCMTGRARGTIASSGRRASAASLRPRGRPADDGGHRALLRQRPGGRHDAGLAVIHGAWILAFLLVLPWLLVVVPTASLAGILVVTGWRLASPRPRGIFFRATAS